jgi:hypothetical protein
MTDSPDLTPEQEAVRRLLADARHEEPTPPQVVARLDDALAALVSERGDGPLDAEEAEERVTRAPVVDLGARRRRLIGTGLLAAAAVVVAGVALGQALPHMQGDDADSGSGGDMATSQERDFSDNADGGSDSSGAAEAPESMKSQAPVPDAAYPTLSSTAAGLNDDLLDLRKTETPRASRLGSAQALSSCDFRGIGQGRRLVAQVDGEVGVVVFRHPDGATQQADLYVCGSTVPVRTVTLPAP